MPNRSAKMVKLDPPGTWCQNAALFEVIEEIGARSFVEIGCGAGDLSHKLCQRGLKGAGIDFSDKALDQAREKLVGFIESGGYELLRGDFQKAPVPSELKDVALSMMVVEHVEDDLTFVCQMKKWIKPGGSLILGVPGRRKMWSVEDAAVGHFRRYDRADIEDLLRKAGLTEITVWSVSVPVANILFSLGQWLFSRSQRATLENASKRDQTELSGIMEIPYKTVFPVWVSWLLNAHTLFPLFVLQRFFYKTNLGLTLIAKGKMP